MRFRGIRATAQNLAVLERNPAMTDRGGQTEEPGAVQERRGGQWSHSEPQKHTAPVSVSTGLLLRATFLSVGYLHTDYLECQAAILVPF